nr:metallophosphoesterase [Pirellula sp.]
SGAEIDWVMSQGVEMLVLSGDLVDDAEAVPHLSLALGELPPELPKFFVLGNHDRAHDLVEPARDAMTALGWLDAGAQDWWIPLRSSQVLVVGNELPWLDRHASPRSIDPARGVFGDSAPPGLILGISHSPDQLPWGQSLGCQLLLCGHTHGGQVRIPGVGPIIAPSWHGSRFASGVFFKAPTVMHVSRGVSGTHPLRWRCPPEVSVLELACAS